MSASSAGAVSILGPPSDFLAQPQNVVVRAMARGDKPHGQPMRGESADAQTIFRRLETLYGKAPRRLVVRMDAQTRRSVHAGTSYLLVYSALQRVPRTRGVFEPDPGGPRLLEAPAVGPLLLADSADLRLLVLPPVAQTPQAARARLDAVLRVLATAEPRSARFAAAELLFRRDLRAAVGVADIEPLAAAIERADIDPQLQDLLLRAAEPLGGIAGGVWLLRASKRVLANHDLRPAFASYVPSLLEAAAAALATVGSGEDAAVLVRHLRSQHPGVAKAALRSLDALDPAAARRAATAALDARDLPSENRQVLERYLGGAAAGT